MFLRTFTVLLAIFAVSCDFNPTGVKVFIEVRDAGVQPVLEANQTIYLPLIIQSEIVFTPRVHLPVIQTP